MEIRIKVKKLNSSWEKMSGLLFQDEVKPIYFETRFGIHTFFLSQKIDVLILDNDNIVRKMREGLLPFRIFIWNPGYFRVIELPSGFIGKNKIKVGAKIKFSFLK